MVSKFTTPFQVHAPQSPIDFELLDNTLSYKQAKFDEGYLQVANTLQSYNNLDLIRPEDIEYRNNKVAQLTEQLNRYGNQDLSDVKVAAQLTIDAKSLSTDKELIGKIQSTKNYRQLVDRYSKMKENPKLIPYYSDINEWKDMKEANQWLTGSSNTLSKSSPTLKTDTDKILGEMMKNMAPTVTSVPNGMYMVEKQLRTENDLKRITIDKISSDPAVQKQLQTEAEYRFKDYTPDRVISESIDTRKEGLTDLKSSLSKYRTQLLDATITKEDRNAIEARILSLEKEDIPKEQAVIDKLESDVSRGDFSQANSEAYRLHVNTYTDAVIRPYIVDKTKVTSNQAAMFNEKNRLHSVEVAAKMQQERDLFEKDWDNKFKLENTKIEGQLAKAGLTRDDNGNIIPSGGATAGSYFQLPALNEETGDVNALSEISSKSRQYKTENRNLMGQMVEEILEKTDRTLLTKLQPLLRNANGANIFDDKGNFLGNKTGLSKAEIDLFQQYDYLLDNAANPELLKDNPLLNGYARYSNALIENQSRWEALDEERTKAQKEVFNNAWKKGEFKGNWDTFIKTLNNESTAVKRSKEDLPMSARIAQGMSPSVNRDYSGDGGRFNKQINGILNKSKNLLEFKTGRSIPLDDKVFNDPSSGVNQNIKGYIFGREDGVGGTGIIAEGKTWSINGAIQGGVSSRDDITGVTDVKVTGIVPNTNQMLVELYGKDKDGKLEVKKRGRVQFNPDEFKTITGYKPRASNEDFAKSLVRGAMQDEKGKPRYFNLAGDLPDMKGNVKYRFFKSGEDELLMNIVTVLPDGKEQEVPVPKNMFGEFKGVDALPKAKAELAKKYMQVKQAVLSINPYLQNNPEELEKATLSEFYKNFK